MDFSYYLVMCKCMSTTVRGNGTVHFTFSFIMKLNIIIITSCDSLFTIFIIKLENGLKKHFRNVARIKHGFVELVVILFTLNTRCDYVIPYFTDQKDKVIFEIYHVTCWLTKNYNTIFLFRNYAGNETVKLVPDHFLFF